MKKAKSLESKEFSLLGFERAVFLFGLSLAIPLKKSTYFENNVFLSGAYFSDSFFIYSSTTTFASAAFFFTDSMPFMQLASFL